jgi:ferric-chelate reductase
MSTVVFILLWVHAGSDIVRNTPYVRQALIIQHIANMTQIPTIPRGAIVAFTTLYAFSLRPIRAHAYELFFYVHLAIVL